MEDSMDNDTTKGQTVPRSPLVVEAVVAPRPWATEDDVLAALVSAARANYQAFRLAYLVSPAYAETGAIPDALRREWILGSFADVLELLPDGSPLYEPLKEYAEQQGVAWAMQHAGPQLVPREGEW